MRKPWASAAPKDKHVAVCMDFTKTDKKTKLGNNSNTLAFPFNLQECVMVSEGICRKMEMSRFCQSDLT